MSGIASISRQTAPVGEGGCVSLGTGCLGIEVFSLWPCSQLFLSFKYITKKKQLRTRDRVSYFNFIFLVEVIRVPSFYYERRN